MAHRVLVNLTTGMEDPERVTVALLVADLGARAGQGGRDLRDAGGRPARAARASPSARAARAARRSSGCSRSSRKAAAELWLCPFCVNSSEPRRRGRSSPNSKIAGATPMWQWAGDDATVIGY